MSLARAAPAGAFAGAMGALCGVGGGIIIVPALRHFTTLSPHAVAGTSLLAVTVGATSSAVVYAVSGVADLPAAALLASTSMPCALIGALVHARLSGTVLNRILAGLMLLAAPAVVMKHQAAAQQGDAAAPPQTATAAQSDEAVKAGQSVDALDQTAAPNQTAAQNQTAAPNQTAAQNQTAAPNQREASQVAVTDKDGQQDNPGWVQQSMAYVGANPNLLGVGALAGIVAGLAGLGGGIITTTLMSTTTDMEQHVVVATSIVALVPTGLVASIQNIRAGNVNVRASIVLGLSCALAMGATAKYVAHLVPEQSLRYLLAAVLGVSSLRMLL